MQHEPTLKRRVRKAGVVVWNRIGIQVLAGRTGIDANGLAFAKRVKYPARIQVITVCEQLPVLLPVLNAVF